ncbi:hypothetical protein M408DRAFT_94288 [Serendipita vermifera MAFF 305830]|uniref:Uncharacterized protein n=1 Tax=Serendipita vermifera MAFF 305830 TaxID=933852 RepID=A0A0C3BQH3_SERVB|nr:hypothetical protein M408DRAFT_94288 [Serendipita vermifera MAFF 305830]
MTVQAKPILKRRSITDILAMAHVPPRNPPSLSSPIYESVSAELEAKQENEEDVVMEAESSLPPAAGVLLQASSRPPLWHTKSDSIIVRQGMRASLSTSPASIHGLTPPRDGAALDLAKSVSLSPPEYGRPRKGHRSDSSSSYQVSDDSNASRVKPKRHISFNSFVEQRIVVDPVMVRLSTVSSSDSDDEDDDEDDDDEDTILQMRSSSGSSIASGRRGSSSSTTSLSETPTTARITSQMTMITAPIAPTFLKEPDHLPAPSPAVVFVAPQGVDEEALKYEMHIASKPHFTVQADRKRAGSTEWSPHDGSDWFEQGEMADYFANVPLASPSEPDREPIYTDEDEDAITVRRRKGGIRSPRISDSQEPGSPTAPLKSAFSRKSQLANTSSPPTVSHQEIARSMARYGTTIREPQATDKAIKPKPMGVPRRSGSSSDLVQPSSRWSGGGGGLVGSGPRSSHLSSSMSSMRSGSGTALSSGATRTRPRGASFEGVDMSGHTSALSGRSDSGSSDRDRGDRGGGRKQTAALFSPPRESDLAETRGRSQRIGDDERPRRGRSLLRTGSSSTISERERSSTTGSSSPMGSLSPRSNSSVGIVGGYIASGRSAIIVPPAGSVRSGSGLRFEAGSWSNEEDRGVDGGDLAQIGSSTTTRGRPPPSATGLVRTSSSSDIPAQNNSQSNRPSGIRRTNSSTSIATKPLMLQRTSSSSNVTVTARQSPQLVTSPVNTVPTLVLQPSSRRTSFSEHIGGDFTAPEDSMASNPVSPASHSLESTGSFWHANELERQDSPATPLSPNNSPAVDDHHELLLAKSSIKPRASGLSLASNGSNSSSATVIPTPAVNVKRRSAQLSSASSSLSSNASTPPSHRRSGSKSSLSTAAPPTPPSAILSSSSSSISTRLVTQTVATRSEIGSPSEASAKQLRRLSGGISSPVVDERTNSPHHTPSPVSPGFVLSNVVGSAKGLFDALWGGGEHSA